MKDLAVIICSYNAREYLDACLAAAFASQGLSFDVCVADNNSPDGSADMVAAKYPQAILIRSRVNGGFSYANNLGMRQLGIGDGRQDYRYVLLLNPDTRLEPDDLARTVAYMDASPQVGCVGVKLVRQDGSLDMACRRSFPTPRVSLYRILGLSRMFPRHREFGRYNLTYLDPDQTAEVDAGCGAFMMVRREAVEQAGLLDEAFWMYGEDLDWALRIKQAGWKVMYYPAVTTLHYKRVSSQRSKRRTTIAFYHSMLIFYRKHYAKDTFFLVHWLILAGIFASGALAYLRAVGLPSLVNRLRPSGSPSA